jgi:anti-sigma factor RsiW
MTDHGLDTLVAGVRCREVLADLSSYVDGELTTARVAELQAHLAGCDRCSRFGGDVVRLLGALRNGLREPEPGPDVVSRVLARLQQG